MHGANGINEEAYRNINTKRTWSPSDDMDSHVCMFIPLQFGPGAMQQHGFARNLDWTIASSSADPNPDEKDPCVELVLTESEYTLKM